jgi:hypothetical protein
MSLAAPALADEYQDAIAKSFPGFKILSRTEFKKEIQKTVKGNPGLITGKFNDDELVDFAAIIRDDSKQKTHLGDEYYRGMFVVCHARDKQPYACQILGQSAISLPFFLYLYRVEPRKVVCHDANNKKVEQIIKRNAIGTADIVRGVGISLEIHQPDGSYLTC